MSDMDISFQFNTLDIPPPFAHQYSIHLKITSDQQISVDYKLAYLDRDQISDDEIASEGFTDNDDFEWNGAINKVWVDVVKSQLKDIPWGENAIPGDYSQTALAIKYQEDGDSKESILYDDEEIEYFLQELIQAIYETAERELPLSLSFLNISQQDRQQMDLTVKFSSREMVIAKKGNESNYSWQKGKSLLSLIYLADYQSKPHKTKNDGQYVSFDQTNWFNLSSIESEEQIPGFASKVAKQLPEF